MADKKFKWYGEFDPTLGSKHKKKVKGGSMSTGSQWSGFGGSSTGGGSGNYGSKSAGFHQGGCQHMGKIKVFEFDGRAVYGAGSSIVVDETTRAVIDLSGSAASEIGKFDLAQAAKSFFGHTCDEPFKNAVLSALAKDDQTKPVYVRLDWPDMGIPKGNIGVAFWRAVWNLLPTGTEGQPAKIIVNCMGGHGRTGTALSALLICNGGYSWADAVNYVRLHHCTNAVESNSQIDYLKALSQRAGTIAKGINLELADQLDAIVKAKAPQQQATVYTPPTDNGTGPNAAPELQPKDPPVTGGPIIMQTQPPVVDDQGTLKLDQLPGVRMVLILDPVANNRPVWVATQIYQQLHHAKAIYGAKF